MPGVEDPCFPESPLPLLQLGESVPACSCFPGRASHQAPYLGCFSSVLLGLMQPKKERDAQIKIPSLSPVLMQMDKNNI